MIKFNSSVVPYLRGRSFSSGLSVELPDEGGYPIIRNQLLSDMVRNKTVLHVGFVDHLPLIDEKIRQGRWLHRELVDSAADCLGIDTNIEGVKYLKEKYDCNYSMVLDVVNDPIPQEISCKKWDFIVLADVLEHVDDPFLFLRQINEKYAGCAGGILITVPNALRIENAISALFSVERVNTDHRFWFTPYTLAKIATGAGYSIENLAFLIHGKLPRLNLLKRYAAKFFPMYRDTLYMELKFSE